MHQKPLIVCSGDERRDPPHSLPKTDGERNKRTSRFTEEELRRLSQLVQAELFRDEQKPLDVLADADLAGNASSGAHATPVRVNVDLGLYRARRAAQRGRFDLARALYLRCLEWDVSEGRAWLGLARLAERANNFALARRLFQYGVRFAATTVTATTPGTGTSQDATVSERATSSTEEESRPASRETANARRPRRARVAPTLNGSPSVNIHLLQAWAVMEESAGNVDRARKLLRSALRAAPHHVASLVAFAMLEHRQGNDEAALLYVSEANKVDPENYYALHVRGLIEWRAFRRYEVARRAFEKSLALNPSNSVTYHAYACMEAWALGNVQRARELFDTALKKGNPRNRFILQSWALLEAEKADDLQAARALFAKGTQAHPRDAAIWQSWALVEARRAKDVEKARKLFAAALHADPQHLAAWQAWAMLEADASRGGSGIEEARKLFQRAVWAAPDSPDIGRVWHAWATAEFTYARDLERARRCCQLGLEAEERIRDPANTSDVDGRAVWSPFGVSPGQSGSGTSVQNFMVETEGIQDLPLIAAGSSYLRRQRLRGRGGSLRKRSQTRCRHGALPMLYTLLGQIEALGENIAAARRCFEKAVEMDPGNPDIWEAYENMERDHGGGAVAAQAVSQRALIATSALERSRARIAAARATDLSQDDNTNRMNERSTDPALSVNELPIQLTEPQPGDFASTGTWIEYRELLRLSHSEVTRRLRQGP